MNRLSAFVAVLGLLACTDDPRPPVGPGPGDAGGGGGGGGGGGTGGSGGSAPSCDAGQLELAGVCRDTCDPAVATATCAEGTCTFLGIEDGEPWGACLPGATGGGGRGSACSLDAPCGDGYVCIEQNGGGRCVPRCDPGDGDTCGAGLRCDPVGRTLGACLPSTCLREADCPDGQTCATWVRPDGGVDLACIFAVGGGAAGAACSADADCASGQCLEDLGICHGGCRTNDDCAGEGSCVLYGFEHEVQSVWVPTCLRDCTDDESCGPGQTCTWFDNRELDLNTVCVPAVGSAQAGAPCTDGADCRSGQCLAFQPGTTGFCDGGCTDDADCGGETVCAQTTRDSAGDDGVWGTADDWETYPRCRGATCSSNADCGAWVCGAALETVNGAVAVVNRCTPPAGPAGAGAPCMDLCASGTCIQRPFAPPEDCDDGVDNDHDGRTDCDDPSCAPWCAREICGDGVDNDADGATDCADLDCETACTTEVCHNGRDDDGNGLVDCDDPRCIFECHETNACNDYADEDGDGLVDCADRWDCARVCFETACDDGVDDDGDLLVDCHDDDCGNAPNCVEHRCAAGDCCTNGLDDDGDGRVDCQDGNCAGTTACSEAACDGADCCSDDLDQDGDDLVDCADPDCARTAACDEGMGFDAGTCADALDQDGDGLVDCADPDCAFSFECLVCYVPCTRDADCPGGRCVEGAGIAAPPPGGNFVYRRTCVVD